MHSKIVSRLRQVRTQLVALDANHRNLLKECDKYYFYGASNTDPMGVGRPERYNDDAEAVYDDFGAFALHKLAGYLVGMTFNPQANWGRLVASVPHEQLDKTKLDWLNKATQEFMRFLNRPEVKFYTAISAAMPECVVGQGMLYVDTPVIDGKKKIVFHAFPMASIAHDLDGYGDVGSVVRSVKMKRSEVIARWPNAPYTEDFIVNTEQNLAREATVYHTVLRNDTYESTVSRDDKMLLPQVKQEKWICRYHVENPDIVLDERSLPFMPFIPLRFYLRPGATYAEGPGIRSLPSVKELSNMALDESLGRQFSAAPPLAEEPGVVPEEVVLGRFARIPLLRPLINQQSAFMPVLPPGYLDVRALSEGMQLKKEQVAQNFYLDRLGTPVKTAEMREVEVLGRQQDNITELVPFLARFDHEVADPVMRIVLDHLLEEGILEAPPKGLKPLFQFQSQLAKAQQMNANREVFQLLEELARMTTVPEPVLEYLNMERLLKIVAQPYTRDTSFIRTEEEVQEARAARAEQEQAAQLQQADATQLTAQADAQKKLAEAEAIRMQGMV